MIDQFFLHLKHYTVEILPAIIIGFLISGVIHEFLPQNFSERYLNKKGILSILYVTIIGMILPVCCFGSLPIAISFRKKGLPLGPVLAFLVATPATSISAILVTWKLFGPVFSLYLVLSVILMGLAIGIIGNFLVYPKLKEIAKGCSMCNEGEHIGHLHHSKNIFQRLMSVLYFGFIDLPKEIGFELIIGIVLAAVVATVTPIQVVIQNYLFGFYGYFFAAVFGILMYICATASVPFAHALVSQGLSIGAGLTLLLVGPITSYGTILVIRKEFGAKILLIYLGFICLSSLLLGSLYPIFAR
ncbi:MAG: permease [Candidatus Omnitrophica bacterium]|nr:permease [Candidatus Omnitrophota bacterium]MCM8831211.1 permease [Candidatus Omnitrophota bacterium]